MSSFSHDPLPCFSPEVLQLDAEQRAEVEHLFRDAPIRPIPEEAKGPFLGICFTNRSGSNFLAQVLASTGAFNEAGEFFLPETVAEHAWAQRLRSLDEYLAFLRRLLSVGGRLCAKLALPHLVLLADSALIGAGDRFLLIDRQDRLDQAISASIAFQNKHWTSEHGRELDDAALVYDRQEIDSILAAIAQRMQGFEAAFAAMRVSPYRVVYEDLVRDPQAAMDGIAGWLGLPSLRVRPERIRLRRQANEVNEAWRARYMAGG